MIFSKNLMWLQEYINLVKPILPELKKLKRISSKTPRKNLKENQLCHGIITKYYNGFDHRITLYTKFIQMSLVKEDKVDIVIKPYSTIDTLCFLAHELAHLRFWEHTPEHKLLEANIVNIFMVNLSKSGYVSEEDEESYYKNCRR